MNLRRDRHAVRRGPSLAHRMPRTASADWGPGHVDRADLTLTTDYVTAREIFMSGNPQAGLQAFMEGKVKIQGDLTKLMAAQASGAGPGAPGLAEAARRRSRSRRGGSASGYRRRQRDQLTNVAGVEPAPARSASARDDRHAAARAARANVRSRLPGGTGPGLVVAP